MQSTSCEMPGWMNHKLESKFPGEISTTSDMQMIPLLTADSEGQGKLVCAALNMPANLENSAVATELEKVSFHSNSKERQCQRMFKLPHNHTHLTR